MLLLCYTIKEVSMQHDLKFALLVTAAVFAVILGFGITAVMTA